MNRIFTALLLSCLMSPVVGLADSIGYCVDDGEGLYYLELVPMEAAAAGKTRELNTLVAVHGLGDSPGGFARLFGGREVDCRLIFPRGPLLHGRGYSWFEVEISDGRVKWFSLEQLLRSAGEIARLSSNLQVASKPAVFGFSQGGMLSFVLAAMYPDLFERFIPVAGYLPAEVNIKEPTDGRVQLRVIHGEQDRLIPIDKARDSARRFSERGAAVVFEQLPGQGHSLRGMSFEDICR